MKEQSHYKKILEDERDTLGKQLEELGTKDVENPENWILKPSDLDIMQADQNEAADRTEEIHTDSVVLDNLEARYRLVLHALKKFDTGSYGVCEVSGEQIEEDRLDANPAARTCKEHLGDAEKLAL